MCLRFGETVHIRDRKGTPQTDGEEGLVTAEADNSDAATNQGMPAATRGSRGKKGPSPGAFRGSTALPTLTLHCWPPELRDNTFLLF